MKYYILTIKNNDFSNYCDKQGIDKIYTSIYKDANYNSSFTYENDSHVRLHCHSIVGFKKTPYFKKYQRKGYHCHFKIFPKEDLNNVKRYLQKEEHPLITNHYYHNYSMVQ